MDDWVPPRAAGGVPSTFRHFPVAPPYASDCEWVVEPGPVSKWKISTERGSRCACYHWRPYGEEDCVKAAVVAVHGYASWTLFQNLKHAPQGARKRRGLFFEGSFVQQVTSGLGYHFYGLDMEGQGYSRPDNDHAPCRLVRGVSGIMDDLKMLLREVREELAMPDNSQIILIGHSTGALITTRVAQQLEMEGDRVGGVIVTGPLYGVGNIDGSESSMSPALPGIQKHLLQGFVAAASALAPDYILDDGSVSEAVQKRDMENVEPRIIEKAISRGNLIEKWVSGDRDLDPVFVSPYTPLRLNFAESSFKEIQRLHANASSTTMPILVIHSKYDPLVPFASSERLIEALASTDKTLESPDGYVLHNPQLEEDCADAVNARICRWMEERFSGKAR